MTSSAGPSPAIEGGPRPRFRILVIDDDPANLELVRETLAGDELEVVTIDSPQLGLEEFRQRRPNVVLLDLVMPGIGGMETLEQMVAIDPGAEVLLMTAHYSTETAVEAIRKGAADYLQKPLDLGRLRERMEELVEEARRRRKASQMDADALHTFCFEGIIGRSPMMLDLFARVRRIAPHFRTVLITGPTGTGKELFARALHKLNPNRTAAFAVCNCAAIVDTLFESELFGYVKGAFTGAAQDKVGLFEYANGGTVFLDEIGELPLNAQAKLLRVLQEQEVQRVGSPSVRKVNVRVIAATNRSLRQLVREKTFREDLFYRLSMLELTLPRLAERPEDLPLLERHFIAHFAKQYSKDLHGLTRRAQAVLARYTWPGNVRELEHVLGSACMMAESNVVDVNDLPGSIRGVTAPAVADGDAGATLMSMEEMERRHAQRVLAEVRGNKVRAGEILGISRGRLYRLLADSK